MILTPNQWRILTNAFEALGDPIYAGMRADAKDFDDLVDLGYLTRIMIKSGFDPDYKYVITHEGRKLIYSHLDKETE